MRKIIRGSVFNILSFAILIIIGIMPSISVFAASSENTVTGGLYEFADDSKYEIDGAEPTKDISEKTSYGAFSISGKVESSADVNGYSAYTVSKDKVTLKYTLGKTYDTDESTSWHHKDDKSKTVNGEKLDSNILSGAIIVQTSSDGKTWITEKSYTDIANKDAGYDSEFYETKDVQQINGCYYRIIVAYEIEKQIDDKKVLFVKLDDFETKKCAEVYTFYLINATNSEGGTSSAADQPRKEMGKKVKTDKDNGYSGSESITKDDPHYGWDLGTFTINGYTRETAEDGTSVFLKNLGDKVTLWFTLDEEINSLNGNEDLIINEDNGAWDEFFEVAKTNFKHGTLIIRYTDYEGVVHDPVIYTDYLAANARTGADTRVELFEEGDYEVALDYEIKDKSGLIDSVSDYKISFNFKIRNGNCMVYPMDSVSQNELSDGAITENGFKLDYAKSRYLNIDVERKTVSLKDGIYVEDVRFNRPAKDGDTYKEEGVYTFTVKNLYTDADPTTKTIYVGDSPILKAMSGTNKTAAEINELIAEGAVIADDGTISFPRTNEVVETAEIEETEEESLEEVELVEEPIAEETANDTEVESAEEVQSQSNGSNLIPIVAVILVLGGAGVVFIRGKKNAAKKMAIQENASEETLKEESEETEVIDEEEGDEQ